MEKKQDFCFASRHEEFVAEFATNSRRLYGYIRSLVPDQNDADDVYQSASLVMWRKFETFSGGSSFFAWGSQIALFEIRKLRDAKKRAHVYSDEALDILSAEYLSRNDDTPCRVAALSSCLQKLSSASRWLIEQRYSLERKPKDIALELGQSEASVYRSLTRIHCWLLACIQQSLSGRG